MLTEAVLSMFVLTTGLVIILALISSSLRQSFDSRDFIIAVELAQEGVELVRNVRDNGFINTPANPFSLFSTNKHCRIGYGAASPNCQPSFDPASFYTLLTNNTSGLYSYAIIGGTLSKFSRYIYIDYDSSTQTATVRSIVYWGVVPASIAGGTGSVTSCTVFNKCVFTEVFLTNWH